MEKPVRLAVVLSFCAVLSGCAGLAGVLKERADQVRATKLEAERNVRAAALRVSCDISLRHAMTMSVAERRQMMWGCNYTDDLIMSLPPKPIDWIPGEKPKK